MFYDVFSALCAKNGRSRNSVATEIGLSNSTVTKWKKTGATPEGATLSKLSQFFDVSFDYLLGNTPESFLLVTEYRLSEALKAHEKETDEQKRYDLACEIDALRESIQDQQFALSMKKAPTVSDGRDALSEEGHHIGILFDRADEKDKLLTHTVLDKYDGIGITTIPTKTRNPGGIIELDVYDEPAAAGRGNYLEGDEKHREQFPSVLVPNGTDFGIRISGNSMTPAIEDGMTVFVKHTMKVESGKVGIFVLNGASYCKQLIVDRNLRQVRLHSFNADYADIIVSPSDSLVTIGQVL